MKGPYDDIINLPRHVSPKRGQMSRESRAAQFAPFAALTGYHAAIEETARRTERKIQLHEDEIALLDRKLRVLTDFAAQRPQVTITFFRPDGKKEGGAYVQRTGQVVRVDGHRREIVLSEGEPIGIGEILDITCPLFEDLDVI